MFSWSVNSKPNNLNELSQELTNLIGLRKITKSAIIKDLRDMYKVVYEHNGITYFDTKDLIKAVTQPYHRCEMISNTQEYIDDKSLFFWFKYAISNSQHFPSAIVTKYNTYRTYKEQINILKLKIGYLIRRIVPQCVYSDINSTSYTLDPSTLNDSKKCSIHITSPKTEYQIYEIYKKLSYIDRSSLCEKQNVNKKD